MSSFISFFCSSLTFVCKDKAAQAAAQAAQTAALQAQYQPLPVQTGISQDQALQILQKFSSQNYFNDNGSGSQDVSELENTLLTYGAGGRDEHKKDEGTSNNSLFASRPDLHRSQSNFSPFSPDPNNIYTTSDSRRDYSRLDTMLHSSKYGPGFYPSHQDLKITTPGASSGNGKISPLSVRPSNDGRYTFAESSDPPTPINRAPGRAEQPISRPSSDHMAHAMMNQEFDRLQDLNNTLASLEIDHWKSPDSSAVPSKPSS